MEGKTAKFQAEPDKIADDAKPKISNKWIHWVDVAIVAFFSHYDPRFGVVAINKQYFNSFIDDI